MFEFNFFECQTSLEVENKISNPEITESRSGVCSKTSSSLHFMTKKRTEANHSIDWQIINEQLLIFWGSLSFESLTTPTLRRLAGSADDSDSDCLTCFRSWIERRPLLNCKWSRSAERWSFGTGLDGRAGKFRFFSGWIRFQFCK